MNQRGRKGRISNSLVAASCAAILAVYAAGSWRTRDADRLFTDDNQTRRPVRPAPAPAASPPVEVAAPVPPPAPVTPEAPPVPPAPAVVAVVMDQKPAPKQVVKTDPVLTPPPAAPAKSIEPASPAPAAVVVEEKPAPEPEPEVTAAAEAAAATPAHPRWLDGYYTGWGTSRHGDIQSFVKIENNRIVDAGVASCETRYPCDVIEHIIPQPVVRQSPDVDRVSRATESADAYYYGLVQALEHAEAEVSGPAQP